MTSFSAGLGYATIGVNFGISIAGGDVNRDGFSDIIVGGHRAGNGVDGEVVIVGGPAANVLYRWNGNLQNLGLGVGSGDYNSDGFSDIIAGAPGTQMPQNPVAGSVIVYGYGGAWKYGFVSSLNLNWASPIVGSSLGAITVTGASPNSQGFLITSIDDAHIPLPTGDAIWVNIDPGNFQIFPFVFSNTGTVTFSGLSLSNPPGAGTNLHFQVVELITGQPPNQLSSYRFSNGLKAVLMA